MAPHNQKKKARSPGKRRNVQSVVTRASKDSKRLDKHRRSRKDNHEDNDLDQEVEMETETANFNEGDQLVEITVHGQYTDYMETNEQRHEDYEEEEGEIFEEGARASTSNKLVRDEDAQSEITFNFKNKDQNNNSTRRDSDLRQVLDQSKRRKAAEETISMTQVQSMIEESQQQTANLLRKQFEDFQKGQNSRSEDLSRQRSTECSKLAREPIRSDRMPQMHHGNRIHGNGNQGKSVQQETVDISPNSVNSEVTIYTNAVKNGLALDSEISKNILKDQEPIVAIHNPLTSSDEDGLIETSDEFGNDAEQMGYNETSQQKLISDFITATRNDSAGAHLPSTSKQNRQQNVNTRRILPQINHQQELSPKQRGDQLIRDAEVSKARIFDVPGNEIDEFESTNFTTQFMRSAMMDENFLLVASHVDQMTQEKIVKGEFVDFGRLIPKDRILTSEDENKMQLVMKGNQSYWVPMQGEGASISSFAKWEQAFRVYSDVYTRAHPSRASELVQYNHVIHTAAMSYTWDNVYQYDKDFRLHLARNPHRSWGLLLQQAWSLRLKDRIKFDSPMAQDRGSFGNGNNSGGGCKRFNRGRCTYGATCKYEHRCFYCSKMGHGVIVCRQLNRDRTERQPNDRRSGGGNHQNNNNAARYNSNQNSGMSGGGSTNAPAKQNNVAPAANFNNNNNISKK